MSSMKDIRAAHGDFGGRLPARQWRQDEPDEFVTHAEPTLPEMEIAELRHLVRFIVGVALFAMVVAFCAGVVVGAKWGN